MSVAVAESSLGATLGISSSKERRERGPPIGFVQLLQQFHTITSLTLGSSAVQKVMNSYVTRVAWEQPYLMHMVLAVACTHHRRLVPTGFASGMEREFALVEATHWQAGLKLYQAELRKAAETRTLDGDALIGTTFLSVIYLFALSETNGPDSYIMEYNEAITRVQAPMMAGSGIPALQSALGILESTIVWRSVIDSANDSQGTFSSRAKGTNGLPPALVLLCDIRQDSSADTNEYHTILRQLSPLFGLGSGPANFVKLAAFGGRTARHFRPLLARKDEKALLLLSYWFALLQQVDQWWCLERARSEYLAITNYLAAKGSGRVLALLHHPGFTA
ncbi:hypothetical protein LTR56_015769 [Elasticomyces elasticus]|nr:hypothetical protein LTR56_015769 [Elasticomyces elasticus]KAK3661980.1 hypothetical protein LTR22_007151 [Elasticomyces elasticus]KAK4933147.1 hypothetical protein LTR49_000631 [Elasticomyces elasticus]KAK5755890.1 hypothetical protein LTS12_014007 [Elasticomyces elasticus]